jgi:hypothetical protein
MKHVTLHLFVLDITLTLTLLLNFFIQPKNCHLIQQQTKTDI